MHIYPAIDLYQGKVVRLERGDFQKVTVYSQEPEETARTWESQGAQWIHVVDLEGAKTGIIQNRQGLSKIREAVRCKIQFGGGLRDLEGIQRIFDEGIERVVVGTRSLDKDFLKKVLEKCGDRIAVGLDISNQTVRMEGWAKDSQLTPVSAVDFLNQFPLGTIIYTDIQKDGMLQGPNFSGLKEILERTQARVILSGGVGSLQDIEKSSAIPSKNFEGVIVGKALYEKKFSLKEALEIANRSKKLK